MSIKLPEIIPSRPFKASIKEWDLDNDWQLWGLTKLVNEIPKSTQNHPWTTFKDRFFYGRPNGAIMVRDLKTGTMIGMLNGHKSSIEKLYTCKDKLVSESTDGDVNIWDQKGKLTFSYNNKNL